MWCVFKRNLEKRGRGREKGKCDSEVCGGRVLKLVEWLSV